jgi:hypothetical protein
VLDGDQEGVPIFSDAPLTGCGSHRGAAASGDVHRAAPFVDRRGILTDTGLDENRRREAAKYHVIFELSHDSDERFVSVKQYHELNRIAFLVFSESFGSKQLWGDHQI